MRDGRPVVKCLREFAASVTEDLWNSIKTIRLIEEEDHPAVDSVSVSLAEQWAFVREEAQKVKGRGGLVRLALRLLQKGEDPVVLISGKATSGKTALLVRRYQCVH